MPVSPIAGTPSGVLSIYPAHDADMGVLAICAFGEREIFGVDRVGKVRTCGHCEDRAAHGGLGEAKTLLVEKG